MVKIKRTSLYITLGILVLAAFIIGSGATGFAILGNSEKDNSGLKEFNDCLAENGMVIYGSQTCPACRNLVETMGGYESVESVFVECTQEGERCQNEMKTNYVPEIQINGEIYEGSRSLEAFAERTGCQLPQ
ncbi:MAG: hypothetical protein WDZ69_00495 [Candidatus Pacearchaeota archaeon]